VRVETLPPDQFTDAEESRPAIGLAERLRLERLFAPVDIASLAYFRIAFGAIMLVEVWRYFNYNWIARYFIVPQFHFSYWGFEWVRPWPAAGMYLHFYLLGALAICLMLGLWYRLASVLFFLGFTYIFLLEQARYLNHFYLIILLSFLLCILPVHRAFSIDALRNPSLRSDTAPAWALWLLRIQIGIPYFYGGIAKLNTDWLQGEPMRAWLASRASRPLLGPLFAQEWSGLLFSYAGLLTDLLIVPLLLWRRTRLIGLALALIFNITNAWLFSIGIFPWLMMAATLMFFPPEWPRRLLRLVQRQPAPEPTEQSLLEPNEPPVAAPAAQPQPAARLSRAQRLTVGLLGLYLAVQLLVPFRHLLYPGDVHWNEQGHRFSWHMKLRSKSGRVTFYAFDPSSGRSWQVAHQVYLTSWQADEMETRPDMILQFSHFLANRLRSQGFDNLGIRVVSAVSLNGRRPQPLIEPSANLAEKQQSLLPADWIVPLYEPLRRR
jgi:vitamin K-dependent gamma-carboxylase